MEQNHDKDSTKELINSIRKQFEIESGKMERIKSNYYKDNDFKVGKFYAYYGPNYYLESKALVFNIYIAPSGNTVDFYIDSVAEYFPDIKETETPFVVDLFSEVLLRILKMDIDLYINKYSISGDGDDFVIAIEFLDEDIAIDAVYLVSDWFKALGNESAFDFKKEYSQLQEDFDKTLYGGPTLYSLIEAGLKRDVPVFYLFEENQFQWGYGYKQLRGRSTTVSTDGIKDTEFTMYKDMVGDFLEMCGFPTPKGKNCFDAEEIVKEAKKLGYPVVVKPVAGHKGQGVVTGIESDEAAIKAFDNIIKLAGEEGIPFEGAIVQQQIYGTDHRLISVGSKFAAALERVPAYVDGDGTNIISVLIKEENSKIIRLDNARSPLCKINIDDDLNEFLGLQDLDLDAVPASGERIYLRRVANISAGGVSINVTDKIHPDNIRMVEDIAAFFNVKCLGIDVLAEDISKSWRDGNFGIIEINAGPGVFMHLAPAYGGSVDVPGIFIKSHFGEDADGRIPIIAGNNISQELADKINWRLHELKNDIFVGSVTKEGVYFNGTYFHKNPDHDQNIKIVLRHQKTSFAIFSHDVDDIFDYGLMHEGADIVILTDAKEAESHTLKNQLPENGLLIEASEGNLRVSRNETELSSTKYNHPTDLYNKIIQTLEPHLKELIQNS